MKKPKDSPSLKSKKLSDAAEDRFGEEEGRYENDDQGGSREPRGANEVALGDGQSRHPDYDTDDPRHVSPARRDFRDEKR